MAAGVAFSAARVTLAEQQRDLATLRVLGFGRREASYVLIAELGALLLVALPLGALLGVVMSRWLMSQFQTDLFTFPYVTSAAAYAKARAVRHDGGAGARRCWYAVASIDWIWSACSNRGTDGQRRIPGRAGEGYAGCGSPRLQCSRC